MSVVAMVQGALLNPYRGLNLLSFFLLFFKRLFLLLTGQLPLNALATDELQIFVLSTLALSCSLLGIFLILRRMGMLANALSHTILLGIVLAYLAFASVGSCCLIDLKTLLLASLIAALLTAFCTEGLQRLFLVQKGASISLVFTSLFALGILFVTLFTRNVHIGLESVMGNVDALHLEDLSLSVALLLFNLTLLLLFYPYYLVTSFDETFAKTVGMGHFLLNYLFLFQVAATAIAAFRAVGVILVLAFFVTPFLAARLMTKNIRPLLLLAPTIAVGASLFAVALSRHLLSTYGLSFSTGSVVVLVLGSFYLLLACKTLYLVKRRGVPRP